ncbi:hypothetical protein BDV96DRAFT_593394 [Lophiotrema nucula]|uniref:Uncharacterized protein n=1 Tax=Lophiotrema nucula TaxID=690887 RepID=A0A6A5ZT72_9PLEO|nr:hypothetical protein BDV96DRAFT_593394 [Lophiotrema nucula]
MTSAVFSSVFGYTSSPIPMALTSTMAPPLPSRYTSGSSAPGSYTLHTPHTTNDQGRPKIAPHLSQDTGDADPPQIQSRPKTSSIRRKLLRFVVRILRQSGDQGGTEGCTLRIQQRSPPKYRYSGDAPGRTTERSVAYQPVPILSSPPAYSFIDINPKTNALSTKRYTRSYQPRPLTYPHIDLDPKTGTLSTSQLHPLFETKLGGKIPDTLLAGILGDLNGRICPHLRICDGYDYVLAQLDEVFVDGCVGGACEAPECL